MEIVCTAILNKPLFTRLHFTVSSVTLSQKRVIRGVRGGIDPRLGIGGLGAGESSKS